MKQLITIGLGALLSFNDRSIAMTKERVITPLSAMPLFVRKTDQSYTAEGILRHEFNYLP